MVFDPWSSYSGVKEKRASRKCISYAASLMDTMQKNKPGEKNAVEMEEKAAGNRDCSRKHKARGKPGRLFLILFFSFWFSFQSDR